MKSFQAPSCLPTYYLTLSCALVKKPLKLEKQIKGLGSSWKVHWVLAEAYNPKARKSPLYVENHAGVFYPTKRIFFLAKYELRGLRLSLFKGAGGYTFLILENPLNLLFDSLHIVKELTKT